jgi:hypothetical protein
LKEEKRLRSKEKTQHKTAIGRLKTTLTNKFNVLQTKYDTLEHGLLDLNQRYESEHFTLGLCDKEIKSMKTDEKKVERDFKAEILKKQERVQGRVGRYNRRNQETQR